MSHNLAQEEDELTAIGRAVRDWFRDVNGTPKGRPRITFREIARRTKLSQQLIGRYWAGTKEPGETRTRLIAKALGVDPPSVFGAGNAPDIGPRTARMALIEARARIDEALQLLAVEQDRARYDRVRELVEEGDLVLDDARERRGDEPGESAAGG